MITEKILSRITLDVWIARLVLAFMVTLFGIHHSPGQQPDQYAAVDAFALGIPRSETSSVQDLASALARGAHSDREKARVIYRWITNNITYDTRAFFSGNLGDMHAANVLRTMKGVCDGYAQLFEALARATGLEAERIAGNSKGYGYVVGSRIEGPANHAWNAVRIDGTWQLVDCTWGAGSIDTHKKFVRGFSDYYFLTPPEQFVYDHLPDDPQKQFLSPAVSKETYEKFVSVQPPFFQNGLQLVSHREGIVRANGRLDVVIGAPDRVMLLAQLLHNGQAEDPSLTYVHRTADQINVSALFPESGSFILRLFVKRRDDPGRQYDKALDYQVNVGEPLSNPASFPVLFDAWEKYGLKLMGSPDRELHVDRSVSIDLATNPRVAVIASLEHDGAKLNDGYTFVLSDNGDHEVQAVFPQPGKYVLTVYAKGNSESGTYDALFSYSFNSTSMKDPDAGFPVVYEQYRQFGARLISPFEGHLKARKPQAFKMRVPGADAVAVVNNGHWTNLQKNDDVFEGTVLLSPGKAEVFARTLGSKQYVGLLRYDGTP